MNTKISTLGDVIQRIRLLKGKDICHLSEASKVPESTIWKIRRGYTENPRLETVLALEAALSPSPPHPTKRSQRRRSPAQAARAAFAGLRGPKTSLRHKRKGTA